MSSLEDDDYCAICGLWACGRTIISCATLKKLVEESNATGKPIIAVSDVPDTGAGDVGRVEPDGTTGTED